MAASVVIAHCVFVGFLGSVLHLWGPLFRRPGALPTFESTLLVFTMCFVLRLLVFVAIESL